MRAAFAAIVALCITGSACAADSRCFGTVANGRFEGGVALPRIDFEALAEHLYQLDVAARSRGSGLALVIFDPRYMDRLLATQRGADLRRLPFMKGRPWVRHDEHYHVDSRIACRPL